MSTTVNIPRKEHMERSKFQKIMNHYYSLTFIGIIFIINIIIALLIAISLGGDLIENGGHIIQLIGALFFLEGLIIIFYVSSFFFYGTRPISRYEPRFSARFGILAAGCITVSILMFYISSWI